MIDEVRTVAVEEICSNDFTIVKTCHSEVSRGPDSADLVRHSYERGLVAETDPVRKLALKACEHSLPLRQ